MKTAAFGTMLLFLLVVSSAIPAGETATVPVATERTKQLLRAEISQILQKEADRLLPGYTLKTNTTDRIVMEWRLHEWNVTRPKFIGGSDEKRIDHEFVPVPDGLRLTVWIHDTAESQAIRPQTKEEPTDAGVLHSLLAKECPVPELNLFIFYNLEYGESTDKSLINSFSAPHPYAMAVTMFHMRQEMENMRLEMSLSREIITDQRNQSAAAVNALLASPQELAAQAEELDRSPAEALAPTRASPLERIARTVWSNRTTDGPLHPERQHFAETGPKTVMVSNRVTQTTDPIFGSVVDEKLLLDLLKARTDTYSLKDSQLPMAGQVDALVLATVHRLRASVSANDLAPFTLLLNDPSLRIRAYAAYILYRFGRDHPQDQKRVLPFRADILKQEQTIRRIDPQADLNWLLPSSAK